MPDRKLLFSVTLKDCRIETFCSGGPGGQHQNKTQSAVRIVHPPSGAVGECREHKSQLQNKKEAFRRLAESQQMKNWCRTKAALMRGVQKEKTIEEVLLDLMNPANITTEVKDEEGNWKIITDDKELKGE